MSDLMKAVLLTLSLGLMVVGDWTICPQGCKCKWVSGKKSAECIKANLRTIPSKLHNEIQSLDLSENQIDRLPSEAFKSVGLVNLHKIHLRDCKIRELHKDTFKDLGILVEIDLSNNKIHVIHPGTFRDNIRLRLFLFNKNPIQKIEANVFNNLIHLQNIELTECKLYQVDDRALQNVTNLLHLKLNGNQLVHINLTALTELSKLRSLVLHDNPWKCDCHLKEFITWVIARNLYSVPTSCALPEHLRGKMWNVIKTENFACKPHIIWPPKGTSVIAESKDVNLGCKVIGNPMPEVHWVHNSIIISDNKGKYNVNRYAIKTNSMDEKEFVSGKWVNLTVNQVGLQDKGKFRCVAKSPGGIDERNVTLMVYADSDGFIGGGNSNESWPLIIGLTTGLTALIIITSILCCWFCCRNAHSQTKKSNGNNLPSNGDVLHHITNSNEQEKSLLTVNPIQKPPRRYEAQISFNNDGVELSELNRKLLDENSSQGNACAGEEDQSIDCIETRQEPVIEKSTSEAHPPDLLAFPSRSQNISPASSSNSNGYDNLTRSSLYPAVQQSVGIPTVHYNFGTLPYSRSHSPFSPAMPVVLPRQGYVTIPRRPRVPSWSSAPTPSLLDDPLSPVKAEPVYDNLGPRTTADGSSALSLNKSFPENPRGRNASNIPYYFHFDGTTRPSLSPMSPERELKKDGILKRTCSAESDIGPVRSKVAPKPAPKPKKDGPLFEDDGEDGTEV